MRTRASIGEDELADRWSARHDERLIGVLRRTAELLGRYHSVTLEGADNLPSGPALIVGNHGHLGYEALLFFAAIDRATGSVPRGLADRWFFRVPLLRSLLVRAGGAYGHPTNAKRLLRDGHWTVCYPGGAREVLKRCDGDRYRLQWERSLGFVRVALEEDVPIVPFAAAGVDHTFRVNGVYAGSGQLLMGDDKYDLPRLASPRVVLPERVPFLFRIGAPIYPRDHAAWPNSERDLRTLHRHVWSSAQDLLDQTLASWRARHEQTKESLACGL